MDTVELDTTKAVAGNYHREKEPGRQNLKVPPNSLEAEQAVLGGLMIDGNAWDVIADKISDFDFYRQAHRVIFQAIAALVLEDKPVDLITVSEKLGTLNELEAVGGITYLGQLAKNTPTAANIAAYADIIRERAILRQLIDVGTFISNSAFDTQGKLAIEILDTAEQKVFAIAEHGGARGKDGPRIITDILTSTLGRIEKLAESDSPITGLSTGFVDLDKMTSGLQESDFIIVAGRPSMGKTTLAINMAENVAIRSNRPVLIFSLEMPAEQLTMKMLASLGRVELQHIRTGKLNDLDWNRVSSAVTLVTGTKIFIDDTPGLNPVEMRARARRIAREYGDLGLIVIDYLQLMQSSGTAEHRAAEVSEISRSLKSLARELKTPVIAASQLNRSLEQRGDKKPMLSDLRESGAIEQDADLILFIYRDDFYHPDSPEKGIAQIIIGKQRNGPTGKVNLTFLGHYSRFENYHNPQAIS